MEITEVIKKARFTEKSEMLKATNTHIFEVHLKANKFQIKEAVEALLNVKVDAVRTSILKPKTKTKFGRKYQTAKLKKAMVTLKPGSQLSFS